jgi:hypothetical protein
LVAISGNWSDHKRLELVTDTGAEKALEVGEMDGTTSTAPS